MKLVKIKSKPIGKLKPVDTPLNVKGQLFQTYRRDNQDKTCDYFEHNQTKNEWHKLVKD